MSTMLAPERLYVVAPGMAPRFLVPRPRQKAVPGMLAAISYQSVATTTATATVAASSVGITTGPGTTLTATPADLTKGPEADIANLTIISLDAGTW